MYQYQPLVPQDVYDLIDSLGYTQEGIFSIVFGYEPVTNVYVTSPFRRDNNPGCWFEWYGDKLIFKDFAEKREKRARDCFQAVRDFFSLSDLGAVSEYIVRNYDSEIAPISFERHKDSVRKSEKTIEFRAKLFNEQDRLFWSPFQISKVDLIKDGVFSNAYYKIISSEKVTIFRPRDLSYTLTGFGDRVKIYNPRRKKKGKWFTTCNENDIFGYSELSLFGELLIITKSYKDYRVIRNQNFECIAFQNEGAFPSDNILLDLAARFKQIFILFDNDEAGIKAAMNLVAKFQSLQKEVKYFYSPYFYLKDPAEIISVKGEEELNNFLWNNLRS